jgi:HPt (histidine-containing phosphotransfer) domain-containing protein
MDYLNKNIQTLSGVKVRRFIDKNDNVFVDRFISKLIPAFIERRNKDLRQLQELVHAKKFDDITKMAHTLYGSCLSYGFSYLSQLSFQLEDFAQQKNESAILSTLAEMQRHLSLLHVHYVSEEGNEASWM